MPRYSLRTLLILLAIGPPLVAVVWTHPRAIAPVLSFVPYIAFMLWQLSLRNRAKF